MLKWCSYCQQFQGETPPYENFSVTHGLCPECELAHPDVFATDLVRHSELLRGVFHSLSEAGRRNDLGSAQRLVDKAIAAKCRPVDILIGVLAPLLYQIGEEWRSGVITVEDEHEFTAFSERVIDLIDGKMHQGRSPSRTDERVYFLMNAPGNTHTLAIRILALWLESRSICAPIIIEHSGLEGLARRIVETAPRALLISMALPEQFNSVAAISALVGRLPSGVRPRVLVGGYAVKSGLVKFVPGADLVADVSLLSVA
jgi:methanogenic corrinoid protein MtbC1